MPAPDTTDAAREALVKAEHDLATHREMQRRAEAARENERVAPYAERRGPLPRTVDGLEWLPVEDQRLYQREHGTGKFVLAWIRTTDHETAAAYAAEIAKGTFRFLAPDETPETRAAKARHTAEQHAKVAAILARDEQAAHEKKMAAIEAQHAKQKAEVEAARARHRDQMRQGSRV